MTATSATQQRSEQTTDQTLRHYRGHFNAVLLMQASRTNSCSTWHEGTRPSGT